MALPGGSPPFHIAVRHGFLPYYVLRKEFVHDGVPYLEKTRDAFLLVPEMVHDGLVLVLVRYQLSILAPLEGCVDRVGVCDRDLVVVLVDVRRYTAVVGRNYLNPRNLISFSGLP